MAEGGAVRKKMSVPVIDPVILQSRRGDIVKEMLPDCVQSVVAGVKPLLNYTEVDAINAADNRGTKVSTLMDYLQRRVHGRSYDAFNVFIKVLAGAQPELFTSLAGRAPTQAEADFCVENYVKSLKECIKSQGHSTDSELDQQIDLDVQHIQLMLVKENTTLDSFFSHDYQSHVQDVQDKAASISATNMLGDEKEQEKPQKVSLCGRAGIGKSTTMQWFARQWATAGWGSGFTMLFLLQLRMLAVSDCQVTTIELLSMFALFQVSDPRLVSLMAPWLRNSANKVILFIDGLDEVTGFSKRLKSCRKISDLTLKAHPIDLCLNILRGDLLPGCTVVSTSRPFTGLSELGSDKQFEIIGFTEADIKQFVQRRHPSKAEEVMASLGKSPLLMSVCGIAFYCALVSSLLAEGVVFVDEDLQTYSRLIAFILVQYVSRKLPDWPFVMEVKSYFPKLAHLAYNGIFANRKKEEFSKVVFDEYDICRADLTTQDIRAIQDAGLLHTKTVKHGLRKSVVAEFFHLSVQEMLASAYLLAHPSNTENLFLDLFSGSQFNIALLYLFGLQYDTTSKWIKDICFSVDASDFGHNEKLDAQFSSLLERLCKQCGEMFRDKFQICQLLYEGCNEDNAMLVSTHVAPGGKLDMSDTRMTIIDLMAVRFVCKHVNAMTAISIERNRFTETLFEYMVSTFLKDHADTLTTLKLGDNSIGQSGVKALVEWLKQNQVLKVLELNNNNIKDNEVTTITQGLQDNNHLHTLKLSGNNIHDNGAIELSNLLHGNKTLQTLDVSHNNIGDAGMKELAAALCHNHTLQTLNVGVNEIMREGVKHVAEALRQNNTLKVLDVHGNGISRLNPGGAVPLAEALRDNSSLHTLNVNNNRLNDTDVEAFADALQYNKTLQVLDLGNCQTTQSGINAIGEALHHNNTLHTLDLSVSAQSYPLPNKVFEALHHNRCLHTLDVSGHDLSLNTGFDPTALSGALRDNNTLQQLVMNSCYKGHIPITLFEALHENTTLQVLGLSNNRFGPQQTTALGTALVHNTSLQVVDVSRNKIGDRGAVDLADALCQNKTLQKLNIATNEIGVSGAKSLAEALSKNATLHTLNLSFNNICNDGAVALADALQQNRTLQVLDVRMNGIGRKGEKSLADVKQHNTTLTRLVQ